nr:hypothetical protein Iba_chr04aCG16840 [Ipomoea batatas]
MEAARKGNLVKPEKSSSPTPPMIPPYGAPISAAVYASWRSCMHLLEFLLVTCSRSWSHSISCIVSEAMGIRSRFDTQAEKALMGLQCPTRNGNRQMNNEGGKLTRNIPRVRTTEDPAMEVMQLGGATGKVMVWLFLSDCSGKSDGICAFPYMSTGLEKKVLVANNEGAVPTNVPQLGPANAKLMLVTGTLSCAKWTSVCDVLDVNIYVQILGTDILGPCRDC